MFKDNTEAIKEEVSRALAVYSFEEILEENDMTIEEILVILVENGFIALPETLGV